MKKIIAILVLTLLMLNSIPAFAQSEEYFSKAEVLQQFGFYSLNKENSNEVVSRGEFAGIIRKIFNLNAFGNYESSFSDVTKDMNNYSDITIVAEYGFMKGNGNNLFMPQNEIMYQDVIKTFIVAMGYDKMAETLGGYPRGYISCGAKIGLTKGENGNYNKGITKNSLAKIIYNSLSINIMSTISSGEFLESKIEDGCNILNTYHAITKQRGKITACGKTSLMGYVDLKDNTIFINDMRYHTNNLSFNNKLGVVFDFYVKEQNGDKTVVAYEEKESYTLEINARDIISFSDRVYKYDKQKEKSAKIAKDCTLIYNGVATDKINNFDEKIFKPQNGTVFLRDTNSNGEYDIVFVNNYTLNIVKKAEKDAIYLLNGGSFTKKPNEDWLIMDKYGSEFSGDDLMEWDILETSKSMNNELITFVVTNAPISGVVEEIQIIDNNKYYVIDDKSYVVANYCFFKNNADINVGDNIIAYLNSQDEISGVMLNNNNSYTYGYIMGAISEKNMSDTILVKMLDSYSEKIKVFKTAKNVTVDGVKYNAYDGLIRTLKKANVIVQRISKATKLPISSYDVSESEIKDATPTVVVRYKLNGNGDIYEIDTAYKTQFENETSLHLSPMGRKLQKRKVRPKSMSFEDAKVCYTKETTILNVANDVMEENIFSVSKGGKMFYDQSLNCVLYSTMSNGIADVILNVNIIGGDDTTVYNGFNNVCLVDKLTQSVNSDGEIMTKMYIFENGKLNGFFLEDDLVVNGIVKDKEKLTVGIGDLVMYNTNAKGNIFSLNRIYSLNEKSITNKFNKIDEAVIKVARVYEQDNEIIGLIRGENISADMDFLNGDITYHNASLFPIYVYDEEVENNHCRSGNVDDIRDFLTAGNEATKLIIHLWKGEGRSITIYK